MSNADIKTKDQLNGIVASLRHRMRLYRGTIPNPDPVLVKDRKEISAFHTIASDPDVTAVFERRAAGVQKMKFNIKPNGATPEVVKLVQSTFEKLKVHDLVGNILRARLYGYAVFELLWRSDTRYHRIVDVSYKPQEWFGWDTNKQLRYFSLENNINGIPCQHRKFLVVQSNPTYVNPYGDAALGKCYPYVNIKRASLEYWVVFGEKYGMPFLTASVPLSSSDADSDKVLDILEGLASDGIAVFPENVKAALLEAQRNTSADAFERLIKVCDEQIAKVILSHGSAADATPGRLGGEDNMTDIQQSIIEADQRLVEDALNQIIKWLVDVNFYSAAYPIAELQSPESLNITRATRDQSLYAVGVRFTKEYYRKHYGLADTEFEVDNTTPMAPFAEHSHDHSYAEELVTPDQALVDRAIEDMSSENPISEEGLKIVRSMTDRILSGNDYADVLKNIEDNFGKVDTKQFEEYLSRALFVADAVGRLSQQQEESR